MNSHFVEENLLLDPQEHSSLPNHFGEYFLFISWAKAPALYVTMSQVMVEEEGHFFDLALRAQIELRNVKVIFR